MMTTHGEASSANSNEHRRGIDGDRRRFQAPGCPMFEVVWMTALGFALPAIGADAVDVVGAGYARHRPTCGTTLGGDAWISGFSHAAYGELYVMVGTDDGVVTTVNIIGGRLESGALVRTDERCEEAPSLRFAVNTMGVEVTTKECANGNFTTGERDVGMSNMLCDFDDNIMPTVRSMFSRAR